MEFRYRWPAVSVGLLAAVVLACGGRGEEKGPDRQAREEARSRPAVEPTFSMVTDQILAASMAGANWPVHGGSYTNQRFSSLDQINRENVGRLVPVWIYQTGLAESFVTTPLVIENAMYLTTPESHVVALNAATGEKLWEFIPELRTTMLCCGPENQGVAAYGDKVFVGTLDARVIALDHRTGKVAWEAELADPEDGYSQTIAPVAADGKVFAGVGGSEYGVRGFVVALDAQTGREAWRWYTIPSPGDVQNGWVGEWKDTDPFGTPLNRDVGNEMRLSARYPDAWKRGGGAVRTSPAYDPTTRTLYVNVGGPAPSLDGVIRPGDNLYAGSIVALDATNGRPRWHFQYIPHDVWDLSGGSAPFIFEADGRKLLGHAGKTGWLYVIDATTGAPVLRSDNFVPQENLFVRPTEEGIRMLPGANGGNGGAPVAYSPVTGLVYVPGLHQPMAYIRSFQPREKGRLWLGGSFRYIPEEPQWGVFSAIDPRTGQIRWQRQVPVPMQGGALATAGNLVFVGQGSGTLDAFDAETGQLLWQFQTGAGVSGSPVTYEISGKQYLVVASGGHYQLDTPRGDALIAFTLYDDERPTIPTQYPEPRYHRTGPARYGAARQVPAAQVQQGAAPPAYPR